MSYIFKNSLKQSLLYGIYNDIRSNNDSYYYFISKHEPWENEELPPTIENNFYTELSTRNDIVFLKKINVNDISFIIPRYDWESGTVYEKYNNSTNELESSMFYCLTANNNVYKCIDNNNGGASTVQPYATSHNIISTADGYKWKYMYSIPIAIIDNFLTSDYMPVMTSGTGEYYSRGSIYSATIENYGFGYSSNTTLDVIGNGYQKNNKLKIISYNLTNNGSGYLYYPELTATKSIENTSPFLLNTEYLIGQLVEYNDNIYEVVKGGVSATAIYPTHSCICSDSVDNGSMALKFVGKNISPSVSFESTTDLGKYTINSMSLNGFIGEVLITNSGYGYDDENPPTITISNSSNDSDSNNNATGICNVVNGRVQSITITNSGAYYSSSQNYVIIAPPFNDYIPFTANANVTTINSIIKLGNYYYKALNTGILSSFGPSHTKGIVSNGEVDLEFVGETALGVAITFYGYGYTKNPLVTISNPHLYNFSYTNFTINTNFTKNTILRKNNYYFIVNVGGISGSTQLKVPGDSGYTEIQTNGAITVTFIKIIKFYEPNVVGNIGELLCVREEGVPDRFYEFLQDNLTILTPPIHISGTTNNLLYIPIIIPNINIITEKTKARFLPIIENSQIVGVICNDPGTGYTYAKINVYESYGTGSDVSIIPNIATRSSSSKQEYIELSAIPGSIETVNIINPGTNYSVKPIIKVEGDGVNCQASVELINGSIAKINIDSPGYNYSYANFVITRDELDPEERIEAIIEPIISPQEGHGKNAITELFAKSLAITTDISNEKINGYTLNTKYRQFGIIKNPLNFLSKSRYNKTIGSCCYTILCNTNNNINLGLPLYDINNNEYDILDTTASINETQINLLLHAKHNSKLEVGQLLYQGSLYITILTIDYPDIDKQSGELLLIDNREAFLPNNEQSVILKTIINL